MFRADLYRALGDAAKRLDDGLAVLHAVSNGHTALDVERVVADTPKLREVRKIDSFTSETGLDVARRRWAQPGLLPGAIYAMTAPCAGARWVALAADGFALRLNTPAEAAELVASIEATTPRRAGAHGSQSRWVSRGWG